MKSTQTCDICGRCVPVLTRRYRGEGYCSTCYARYFTKRPCPKCGKFARLPIDDPSAICRKCEAVMPCIRCGKSEYKIGKLTQYGPVCNACSVYFREPRICPRCGKESRKLSRALKLGITEQVCPQCAGLDRGTCSFCRRHRRLYESSSGNMLCKDCLDRGTIRCPECGRPMPAGRKSRCESCYWQGVLNERVKLDRAGFCSEIMGNHFEAFGRWLGSHSGPHKASLAIHRHYMFFKEIESRWQAIPDYQTLLNGLGALHLRRHQLSMTWMEEYGFIRAKRTFDRMRR